MSKILITGGSGLAGNAVLGMLLKSGLDFDSIILVSAKLCMIFPDQAEKLSRQSS